MGQIEKLIERIKSIPSDLTYDELTKCLNSFGYVAMNKGKTSGSRVKFYRETDGASILLHKPHPQNVVRHYAIKQVIATLQEKGDI